MIRLRHWYLQSFSIGFLHCKSGVVHRYWEDSIALGQQDYQLIYFQCWFRYILKLQANWKKTIGMAYWQKEFLESHFYCTSNAFSKIYGSWKPEYVMKNVNYFFGWRHFLWHCKVHPPPKLDWLLCNLWFEFSW